MKRKNLRILFILPIIAIIAISIQSIDIKADTVTSPVTNNQNDSQNNVANSNQSSGNDNDSNNNNDDKSISNSTDNNQNTDKRIPVNRTKKVKQHHYFRILSTKKTNFNTIVKKNRSLYIGGGYNTNKKSIKSYKNSKNLLNAWVHVIEFENTKLGKYAHIIHNGKDEGWINNSALDYSSFKLNNIPLISQRPQLPTGCEITAVTMMINYATGKKYSKTFFANKMPRNSNPNKGFVGSPYSKSGWYIYPPALMKLVHRYAGSSVNLTGKSTNYLKHYLKQNNHPIVIWIANTDGFPNHAVTMTGFNKKQLYYNDPWLGKRTGMNIKQINIHRSHDHNRAISY
ncbi:C39 family peptidase [Apilactobacillus micheneri]|uniref:C39 family peptidase n=1 Tax=Apilactobacillus micheneri TaxID=1899430 RepID=UPI000D50B109|nr:C39 family peptidase [Apilactobacillus micheneri]GAY79322.1 hypothetical protein NBRC113063_00156 [Apilactobacillus micheneri]